MDMDFVSVPDKKYGFLCQITAKPVIFSIFRCFLMGNDENHRSGRGEI